MSLALDKNLGINEPFRTARRVVPVVPVSPCDNDPRRPRPFDAIPLSIAAGVLNGPTDGVCPSAEASHRRPFDHSTPCDAALDDRGGVGGSVDIWL